MILDEARSALLRGEAQQALDALERHRRTFPSPVLGEERDALQVQALVKAGRYAEARARGEAFGRRVPDSFYLPMVNAALASIP
jgi:outer membrane protein assembly factor BamD (BamD/ComL family)